MNAAENGPQRTCIVCRESRHKDQLLRYVVAPDGQVLVDYRQKLPGRGAYTCLNKDCMEQAVKRKAFQRAFKGRCQDVDGGRLLAELLTALDQKIANLLGIARKSGQYIAGSNMVIETLRKPDNNIALIFLAEDISAGIADKINNLSRRHGIECFCRYDKSRIGQLLGKEQRSVIAITSGELATSLLDELSRYRQLAREN